MNIIGNYNGIKFRFTYKEYFDDEEDDIIYQYIFSWPGRIPSDKDYAEQGIRALFTKRIAEGNFDYRVANIDISTADTKKEEETIMVDENVIQKG